MSISTYGKQNERLDIHGQSFPSYELRTGRILLVTLLSELLGTRQQLLPVHALNIHDWMHWNTNIMLNFIYSLYPQYAECFKIKKSVIICTIRMNNNFYMLRKFCMWPYSGISSVSRTTGATYFCIVTQIHVYMYICLNIMRCNNKNISNKK